MRDLNIDRIYKEHPKDVREAIHFAVVLRRNKVISVGFNRQKFLYTGEFTYHAEIQALKKAGRRARGSEMVVGRIMRRDRQISTAKPCSKCQERMDKAGIIKTIDWVDEI